MFTYMVTKTIHIEIAYELEKMYQSEIMKFYTKNRIKCSFNRPLPHNMGGCWGKIIQSIKKIPKKN